ncbi:uncharacterized protein LOC113207416 [Frankliniella occidentalis]|uniref:Odorant receptor n=1 Tax=Frankliniella occidentalis TaxID=133901 RepID=A0A9C6X576_FRAOC|nr:uncharacterized protein LOC113207416 [Frankliniella occidentalis]
MTVVNWDDEKEEGHSAPGQSKGLEAGLAPVAVGDEDEEEDEAAGVLQMPVFYMRAVFLWPEGLSAMQRFLARYVFPLFNTQIVLGGLAFIVLEEHPNFMPPLTTAGDCMAASVLIAKLIVLRRAGPRLVEMRRQLQYGFKMFESQAEPEASRVNARCVSRCRTISRRFAWLYLPLSVSAALLLIFNAFAPADQRHIIANAPRALLICPYTYWPLFVCNMGGIVTFLFFSAGYDTLFLSLCLHLSCKCEILRVLLRRAGKHHGLALQKEAGDGGAHDQVKKNYEFEHWNDDGTAFDANSHAGSRREMDDHLRSCVRYHHMVIRLRDETERIFSGVSLFQMLYVLLALCIPALRLLHEKTISAVDVVFILLYFAWNFSQLLFYCWFADVLAEASEEVSVAAYAALRPPAVDGAALGLDSPVCSLGRAGGATLRLITLRAQRPLHLTAGRITNLTLVLYLEIIRRSQSIFSYLIRLR